jgi:hypothetical protein
VTNAQRPAHIFVATLGASNYTYAEARWSEGLADVAMSQYIVLRAGVFSIATAGLAALGAYTAAIFAMHYGVPFWTASHPAGVLRFGEQPDHRVWSSTRISECAKRYTWHSASLRNLAVSAKLQFG